MVRRLNKPPFYDQIRDPTTGQMHHTYQNYFAVENNTLTNIVNTGTPLPKGNTAQIEAQAKQSDNILKLFYNTQTQQVQFSPDGTTIRSIATT